jgi:TRAP-type transport system periplasmic protein
MKKLNKILASATLLTATFLSSVQAETLRIGSVQAADDPIAEGFYKFKEGVEARTNGDVKVQVFMNGQIGNTQDMMDQALAGANVASFTDASRLADYVPELGVIGAPYVFSSYEEAESFVLSDTFNQWANELQNKSGLVVLAFNWYQGPRHLLTKKMIDKPEDIEGLRIRSPGAPAWMAGIKSLGAIPTPMDWAEIYSALQLGAIDGAGSTPAGIWGSKLHEVINDITLTAHIQLITGIVVGERFWNKLSLEEQKIVKEEAVKAGSYMSKLTITKGDEYLVKIANTGTRIHEIDTSSFQDKAHSLYPELGLESAYQKVKAELTNKQ